MKKLETQLKEQQIYNDEIASFYWKHQLHTNNDEKMVTRIFPTFSDYKSYWNNVDKKIENFCNLHGRDKKSLIEELHSNTTLQLTFAINASKQKTHQKVQELNIREQLQSIEKKFPNVVFSLCENERDNRFIISDKGNIKSKTMADDSYFNSKMFDYIVNVSCDFKNYKIFLVNKYTKEMGGSQDNTKREIETTYKYCLENKDDNCLFLFILDGGYWQGNDKHIVNNGKIYHCSNYDFKETMEKILIQII